MHWLSSSAALALLPTAWALACCGGDTDRARAPDAALVLRRAGQPVPLRAYLDPSTRRGVFTLGTGAQAFVSPVYAAWKVMAADFDADGDDEIVLGAWSSTPRHREPEPHRTIWVLHWDGERVRPLYRGSALSRPLVDAMTASLDGDARAELLALERAESGCVLTAYAWTGFGFAALSHRPVACTPTIDEQSACAAHPHGLCWKLTNGELAPL